MEPEGDGRPEATRGGLTAAGSDRYAAAFAERVRGMDDESVLRTLIHARIVPGEYTGAAVAALEHELVRRGIRLERVQEILDGFRQQRIDAAADVAGRLAEDGQSRATIETYLRQVGMDPTDAMFTAAAASRMTADQRKRAAVRNMASGAALGTIGLAVLAANWLVSVQERGHLILVYPWWIWLVVAGVAQFARGLKQGMSKG